MRQRVAKQVARLPQRRTGCQQLRAADRDNDVLEQAVAGEAGIFAGAETDGDVDVVGVEVAHFVADVEAQLDVRIDLAERFDAPHQPARRNLGIDGDF